jgi:hypothetical protein
MTSTLTICVALALLYLGSVTSLAAPRDLSPSAAARDARRDINAGHMKIYIAGTEGAYEPGVHRHDLALLSTLPRDRSLPMGCTNPLSGSAIEYATVYNRAVVEHLRRAQPH